MAKPAAAPAELAGVVAASSSVVKADAQVVVSAITTSVVNLLKGGVQVC